MYITLEQRRKITIAIIVLIIIDLVALGSTTLIDFSKKPLTDDKNQTTAAPQQTKVAPPSETSKTEEIELPYTQYEESTSSCKYYYEGGDCYVPLSYCVPDATVKSQKQLDREKYCSSSPQLNVRSLRSPEGSVCPFIASEGDFVNLRSIVEDPDEQDPTNPFGPLGRLDLQFSSPFSDNNGVWQTARGDAGIHNFTVYVTDGEYASEKEYCIEIALGNRPPALSNLQNMEVTAGEAITLDPKCADPDNDAVTLGYQGDISNRGWMASNTKNTAMKDVGKHVVTVSCSDARGLSTFKSIAIFVFATAPESIGTLQLILDSKEIVVNEGEKVVIMPHVRSEEGRQVTVTYSGWMDSAEKQTTYTDAGTYSVEVAATDGISTVSDTVTVTVINVNRPPEIVGTERVR